MKYLLLGGAGFIGSHLSKRLIENCHEVTVIDCLKTSKKPDFKVNFINADITKIDLDILEKIISETDIIYFLAASVGVNYIDQFPQQSFSNNIKLMNVLIPLFEKYNKKVIFTSSSEVYGEGPFSEDSNLSIGPPSKLRWSYAAAKLITEFSITTSNFPFLIFRLFNVVGPNQTGEFGMVLPRFIESAKNNRDIVVYGDGFQKRSFCHIKDAIEIFIELEKFNNEIFNVGSENLIEIKELAKRVIDISKSNSKIIFRRKEEVFSKHYDDIKVRIPNLLKVQKHTNYKPLYNIDDIIKDMLL